MADIPITLTIAGSDSGGGAGIQADLKAFSANKVYGASVITALTAQNTLGVTGVHDMPPEFVTAQLDAVFSDLDVKAVKIGMLSQVPVIEAVAEALKKQQIKNIVFDPVMVATSGDLLLASDAVDAVKSILMPLADVITPNLFEAAELTGKSVAQSLDKMRAQGNQLIDAGAKAVLIKGGHSGTGDCVDLLVQSDGEKEFKSPRIDTSNTHGTGCSLSSAIAAQLAHGKSLEQAVSEAKDWLTGAISAADDLNVGQGSGPVHHFHALW
ncbi:MAG: bifunctional hydroxymethylpyrimidine kinase/phosphomethylpyrimidine kinase [Pseudomonadota bacterium]